MTSLETVVGDRDVIARFVVDGEPCSKARARFTQYGSKTRSYTPEKTKHAEAQVARQFRAAVKGYEVDGTTTFGIAAAFHAGTYQRRDVDNMLKLICDGLNKVCWKDDVQVTEVFGFKDRDTSSPRTEVVIYRTGDFQKARTSVCVWCGGEYVTYNSWNGLRKYCSKPCRLAAVASQRSRKCKGCGESFLPPRENYRAAYCSDACFSEQKRTHITCVQCGVEYRLPRSLAPKQHALCSRECSVAFWRAQRKGIPKGTCATCGGPVSRKEYTNCRPCHLAGLSPLKRDLRVFQDGAA